MYCEAEINVFKKNTALVVKSLMEHQYRVCDNQSRITLECDMAHWYMIRPKPQREPPVNIANQLIS